MLCRPASQSEHACSTVTAERLTNIPVATPFWISASASRWITADGRPVTALDQYRWLFYRRNEHDDYEGAKRVEADMDRQRAEYRERIS
jgi:hypothetical protein